jgi:alkanesulfonate monooxygenase SsuD/methylene tetrahydromethanopterin reductase-like flavin-dependent oxidoreductase (luciferase family)
VLGQGYRNPALLAKMAATLQFLTSGRLVLGLGAGWHEEEYWSYGYEYPTRNERVEQLVEVVTILRLMWQGGPATVQGRYYSIADAVCSPVPDPAIPIMVGTAGKRVVRLRPASFVGLIPTDSPVYDFDQVVHGPTPQDALASFRRFVDLGVTHIQVWPDDLRILGIFATEVAPQLAGLGRRA